jgi:hypothetical protein
MSTTQLTEDDEGKPVVSGDGDEIGMITEVRGGTAHVDPDPGMFDSVKAKLDWGDAGEDTYPLEADKVADVTDDEVRIG